MRTGIVLAAGFGSRLVGSSDETSLKPLTPVAGIPLLVRTLNSLEKAGCEKVVIVLGHGSQEIQKSLEGLYTGMMTVVTAFNPYYDRQNGLSLLAAADQITGDFVLTMADHVFSDEIMEMASAHRPPENGATLMVDYNIEEVFDIDDATKVETDPYGYIVHIGKQLPSYNCVDTGLFIGTQSMIDEGRQLFRKNGDASLSEIVQSLSKQGKMNTKDIKNYFWQDVDTPEMLEHAEKVLSELG